MKRPYLLALTAVGAGLSVIAHGVALTTGNADPGQPTRLGVSIQDSVAERDRKAAEHNRALDMRENALKALEAKMAAQQPPQLEPAAQAPAEPENNEQYDALAKIYQAMKPAKAAAVLEKLDMDVQVKVAQRIRERSMGAVLANMTPDAAAALTMALAGRQQGGGSADASGAATPGASVAGNPAPGKLASAAPAPAVQSPAAPPPAAPAPAAPLQNEAAPAAAGAPVTTAKRPEKPQASAAPAPSNAASIIKPIPIEAAKPGAPAAGPAADASAKENPVKESPAKVTPVAPPAASVEKQEKPQAADVPTGVHAPAADKNAPTVITPVPVVAYAEKPRADVPPGVNVPVK